jgi:hypothetical protein
METPETTPDEVTPEQEDGGDGQQGEQAQQDQ